jgi:hypothetical protein
MEDRQPHVTLDIPDAEDFEESHLTIAVPYQVVTGSIDVLQAMIAQWKRDDGIEPDDELWGYLMGAAGRALGGLIEAYARQRTADGRASNEMMREHIARNMEINKQWRERIQHQLLQPAASQQAPTGQEEHGPAADRDPGWEF